MADILSLPHCVNPFPVVSFPCSLEDYVQVLEKEVNIDFCRSMNRIIFDKTVSDDPQTFAFVTVPDAPAEDVPSRGICYMHITW